MESIRYYFLVASKDFLLYQEPVEEILRERIRHYKAIKKNIDFFFTTNLEFLNLSDLQDVKKNLITPSAAIVSRNPKFIDWLKLRIHYGVKGSFVSSEININKNCLISS